MLGLFHATWATADCLVDFAIGDLLALSHEKTHLVTSGMMFGRKARLLSDLIRQSDHPKKADLKAALRVIRGTARRDVIAHSYMRADDDGRLVFLERSISGDFAARSHAFTRKELAGHVQNLCNATMQMAHALGVSDDELNAFVDATAGASRAPSRHD